MSQPKRGEMTDSWRDMAPEQVPTYIYKWQRDRIISGESGRGKEIIAEARIMYNTAKILVRNDWSVRVLQGDEGPELPPRIAARDIMLDSMQCDVDRWIVYDIAGKFVGWVFFVQGNHPSEVICDHTVGHEQFEAAMDEAMAHAETYDNT